MYIVERVHFTHCFCSSLCFSGGGYRMTYFVFRSGLTNHIQSLHTVLLYIYMQYTDELLCYTAFFCFSLNQNSDNTMYFSPSQECVMQLKLSIKNKIEKNKLKSTLYRTQWGGNVAAQMDWKNGFSGSVEKKTNQDFIYRSQTMKRFLKNCN